MYDFSVRRRIQDVDAFSLPGELSAMALNPSGDGAMTPERLCDNYAERVYRFAAMVAKGAVEADDLAQDALERALKRLNGFDAKRGTIDAWLWRIVVNAARDAGRLDSRRRALLERLLAQPGLEQSSSELVESLAVDRLADADLLGQVRGLPARDRAVIALRFGADLDHASIGAVLGMRPGTAGAAVRRALARLRSQLEAQE